MLKYREIAPPSALANTVECFWTASQGSSSALEHRVLPDGCADLLFTRDRNGSRLQVVGPMSRFARFTLPSGQLAVAMRFRPGCWTQLIRVNAHELTDRTVPLEELVPALGHSLHECLMEQTDLNHIVQQLASVVVPCVPCKLQSALAQLARRPDNICLKQIAVAAGLSSRHFRRKVQEQTGFSPKLLARILRFRRAAAMMRTSSKPHAEVALACGFFDQSHLISEYHHFAGETPAVAIARRLA